MSRIDLTGVPGFKADGPPANDWRPEPLPIIKAFIGFVIYTLAIAMLCAGLWLAF